MIFSKDNESFLYYLLSTNSVEALVCLAFNDILNSSNKHKINSLQKHTLYFVTKYIMSSAENQQVLLEVLNRYAKANGLFKDSYVFITDSIKLLLDKIDIAEVIPKEQLPNILPSNPNAKYLKQYEEITKIWFDYINKVGNTAPIFIHKSPIYIWQVFFNITKMCRKLDAISTMDLLKAVPTTLSINNKREELHASLRETMYNNNNWHSTFKEDIIEEVYTPFSLRYMVVPQLFEDKEIIVNDLVFLLSNNE